jgi:hypothetical protein
VSQVYVIERLTCEPAPQRPSLRAEGCR